VNTDLVTGDVPGAATYFNPLKNQTTIPCTSGTRPSSPGNGMRIFETDTKMFRYRDASVSKWRQEGAATPLAMVVKTTGPSIANNTVTTISWDTAVANEFGIWNSGSANLLTVPYDGVWQVELSVRWASQATVVGYRQCRIDVNGVEANVFNLAPTTALNATNVVTALSHPMELAVADQIEGKVFQNSGGALSLVSTTRMIVRLLAEGT
jgi:hypothetical protein